MQNNLTSQNKFATCVKYLKYEYFNKNSFVFHHLDSGDKFYFILQGKIAILIPKSDEEIKLESQIHSQIHHIS